MYVKNIKTTVSQFLQYMNVYKYNNQFENIDDITLNDIRTLTNTDIYSYIFYLAKNNYKQDSTSIKIEHLRTFFDFLFKIKHDIFKQPFKKIQAEKRENKQLPNYLSLEEARKLLSVSKSSNKFKQIRNNAIITLNITFFFFI